MTLKTRPGFPVGAFLFQIKYYLWKMAIFGLTIQLDKKTKKLLKEINCKLNKLLESDEKIKQEIMDKLNNAISDIKSTIKN